VGGYIQGRDVVSKPKSRREEIMLLAREGAAKTACGLMTSHRTGPRTGQFLYNESCISWEILVAGKVQLRRLTRSNADKIYVAS
jgi:hypothetical protein